jgi:hypothetical protein
MWEIEAYTIRSGHGIVLYVGRKTPGDPISNLRAERLLKKFMDGFDDPEATIEVEGTFTSLAPCNRLIAELKSSIGALQPRKAVDTGFSLKRKAVQFCEIDNPDSPNRHVDFLMCKREGTVKAI